MRSVRLAAMTLFGSLLLSGGPAAPAWAETAERYEQVYLTPAQALKVALPDADRIIPHLITPTPEARERVERRLGRHLTEPSFTFEEGRRGESTTGWALILEEQGKYFPITFVVGLDPAGQVGEVAVMVYREKRGDAVRRHRFLGQFEGKGPSDPLMVNRDIVHLTGATVSSWAIAAGVKKAVVLFDAWKPQLEQRP